MSEVVNDVAQHRYELAIPGSDDAALAYYIDEDGYRILTHTIVPYEYSGKGIGSRLARGVFEDARAKGLKLVLRCEFMAYYYARHPEYSDVVAG